MDIAGLSRQREIANTKRNCKRVIAKIVIPPKGKQEQNGVSANSGTSCQQLFTARKYIAQTVSVATKDLH